MSIPFLVLGTADRQSASKIAVFAFFLAKSTTCCFSALQRLINSIGISISSIHSFGPAGPRCKSVCVVFPQQCQVRGLSPDKVRCSFRCGFRSGSCGAGVRAGSGSQCGVPGWLRFRSLTLFYCNFNCAFEVCFSIFSAQRARTYIYCSGSKSSRAPCQGCSCFRIFQPTSLFPMPPRFIFFKTLLVIYLGSLHFASLEPCDFFFGMLALPKFKFSRGWHHAPQVHRQSDSQTIK